MASPFKVFRKNQKLMLAFLGVLVMVGFVILPVWMQGMAVQRRANLRVASTTRYGDLQEGDLQSLRWRRQAAIRFFQTLAQQIYMARGDPMAVAVVLDHLMPEGDITSGTSEEALVETWLLARRAEALGFLVDDRVMQSFLNGLAQDRISEEGWARVLASAGVSQQALVGVLRDELLAFRLKQTFRGSLGAVTPAQRWDYFQRLNRKVTIESLPVPVADFVDQVADPDEATLEAFFDQHKDELPDPTSPEPGFREPAKIAVEYLKAEFERFFEQEQKAVTQDEIAEYYQENKETYRQEELPTFFDEKPTEKKPEARHQEEKESPDPKAPKDEPNESAEAEAGDSQGGEETPEVASPAKPAEKQPAPGEQKPAATEPANKMSPATPNTKEDTSAVEMTSPFRLAAFAEEGSEEPKGSEPARPVDASEESADEAAPDGKASPDEEAAPDEKVSPDEKAAPDEEVSPDEKPAPKPAAPESAPAEESPPEKPAAKAVPARKPPTEPASPKEPASKAKAPEPPAAEKMPAEGPALGAEKPSAEKETPTAKPAPQTPEAAAPAKPEYVPLEKVADEIRRKIARDRANEKIESLLSDLRNQLSQYHDKLVRYEVDVATVKEGEAPKPPEKLDFAQLAEAHGLIARRTGLVSSLETEQLDIGKSTVGGQVPFLEAAFELPKHRPEVSQDANGDRYLFWKLEEIEEKTPSFEDQGVRERTLRQWKLIEARSLAVEAAKRMAGEARTTGKPLAEAFAERPGVTVTESEPFSWLDYGAIPAWMAQGPPSLSDVQGVEAPGNDFMQAVFDLEEGQIGTAANQPQTVVYVFQVTDSNPLPSVLWDTFVNENYRSYFRAADHDRSVAEQAWLERIRSATGFRWNPEYRRQVAQRQAG